MISAILMLALAAVPVQDKKDPDVARVTLEFQDTALGVILESIRKITGIPIELDEAARKNVDLENGKVTAQIKDTTVTSALKLLFGIYGLEVNVIDKKKVLITGPK
jgi:type II secretory pathway component GspD/PulD (secretin)